MEKKKSTVGVQHVTVMHLMVAWVAAEGMEYSNQPHYTETHEVERQRLESEWRELKQAT